MYGYFYERNFTGGFPYTDLALERRRADTDIDGVSYRREESLGGSWERIKITSDIGAASIGRPKGVYDTLLTKRMDLLDREEIEDAIEELARELCYMCEVCEVSPERLLIVGLGNAELTPDSIGARSAGRVKATMHIKEIDEALFNSLECSEIAVMRPSVASVSGMDALTGVMGVSNMILPDAIIAIDALATHSVARLGTTVQVSSTGIQPGSGLGNSGRYISEATLGVPVIALGVPTVIDARMLSPTAGETKSGSGATAMFVSPKEIDEIVAAGAEIIGGAINQAFGLYS